MKNNNMTAIAVNKSLLKEYQSSECPRTVYLNDGDEFQIKLFNPESTRVSARIYIDNQYLGKELILRPGESIWLERYLDRASKFRFETYEVEDGNKDVDKAIQHNGEIRVEFYHEKPYQNHAISGLVEWDKSISITPSIYYHGYCSTGNVELNSVCTTSTSSVSTTYCVDQSSTKETGRVSDGGYSLQQFTTTNMDSEIFPFIQETIKILPTSRKPFTKNDLSKVYCVECGRKIKSKFKYCPFCGAQQE